MAVRVPSSYCVQRRCECDETAHCTLFGRHDCPLCKDKNTLSPPEATQRRPGEFENQFLAIQIVPGWTVATSTGQTLTLVKGKYLLSINPIFLHASGVIGGRFGEIASGKK